MDKNTGICLLVETLNDTDILDAYAEIKALSEKLGGVKIKTTFNGVEMTYYGQSEGIWETQYVAEYSMD